MFFSFTTLAVLALVIFVITFGVLLYRASHLRGQNISWPAPHSFRSVLNHKVDAFAYFLVVVVREFAHHLYLYLAKLAHRIVLILKYVFHVLEKRFGRVVEDAHARAMSQPLSGDPGRRSKYLEEIKDHADQVRQTLMKPDSNL